MLGACATLDEFFFGEDELEPQQISTFGTPAEETYPSLATVPEQPPMPSPSPQREQLIEGLAADREHARYSDEPLTAESVAVPPAEPPRMEAPPPPMVEVLTAARQPEPAPPQAVAPPPPDLGQGTTQGTAPPPPPVEVAGSPGAEPMMLLQQRAYQEQAIQEQRMQQMAMQQQAFEQQARQQAIEQQMLRQQIIEQQAAQQQAFRYEAQMQLAGPAPMPAPAMTAPGMMQMAGTPAYPMTGAALAASSGRLLGLIYFSHGSANLDAKDREVLKGVVAYQQQTGGRPVQVVGHSSARTNVVDAVKHQMTNFNVSMSRANAVAAELVKLGASSDRVQVSAMSDSAPVYHEFMPTGEAGNRRVEIYLQ